MKKIITWIDIHIRKLLLISMLICVLGIIVSFLFKNEYITTWGYNTDSTHAQEYSFIEGGTIEYQFSSEKKMLGVQIKFTTYEKKFTSGTLHYELLSQEDGRTLGSSTLPIASIGHGQSLHLSFSGFPETTGNLLLRMWCDGSENGDYPGVYANTQEIPDVVTVVNGEKLDGNLIIDYNYPAYNRPLLWYFLLAFFFLGTVFVMTEAKKEVSAK